MLRPLYPPLPAATVERRADIVVIPGVNTPQPQEWFNSSGNWLEELVNSWQEQLQVLHYEYHASETSKVSVLQQVVEESHSLLACLDEQYATSNLRRYPLVFVCHSLGGIILKEALCVLRKHFFQYRNLVDRIGGILFLGTPHLRSNVQPSSNIVELILRSTQSKPLARNVLTQTGDNILLTQRSRDFELAGIEFPILSSFEGVESKVYRNLFAKFTIRKPLQVKIISEEFCKIGLPRERLIEVHCAHNDLCKLVVGGPLYCILCDAIKSIVDATETQAIATNSIPSGLENLTLRSRSSFDPGCFAGPNPRQEVATPQRSSLTPDNSREAAAGSTTQASLEIVYLPTNFEGVKRNPRLPCFCIAKQKNPRFFGRTDVLAKIDEVLLPDGGRLSNAQSDPEAAPYSHKGTLRSFALCGLGGTGKTDVAIEYAYSRSDKFDAVFWVSADDKNILTEEFAKIAIDLNLSEQKDTQDLPDVCDVVKGWLCNPVKSYETTALSENDASWLLIFDNVDNLEILEEFWPTTGIGAVLVTSRDALAKSQTYTANTGMDLLPFTTVEAAEFIRGSRPQQLEAGQYKYVEEIAAILGGLPLLIVQMFGVMHRLRLTYRDFLRLFDENDIDHIDWSGSDVSRSEQVFKISSRIGMDGLSDQSLGLLQMISLLDPDRVPEKILLEASSQKGTAEFPGTYPQYYEARAQLQQASLISFHPANEEISLHRVVQGVVRANMENPRLVDMFEATLHAVSDVWPFGELVARFTTDRYEKCADIFPSVVRLKNMQETLLEDGACRDPDSCAALYNDAGWYWFERGFPEEAKEFFQLTERLYEQSPSISTEQRAYMLRRANLNQATASMETNDREDCLIRYRKWLDDSSELVSISEDPAFKYELACIYNETGVAYAMNEKFNVAMDYFLESVERFQELPNYKDTMLDWPLPNIGFMHWMLGEHEAAERVLLEILEVQEAANGVDDIVSFKTGKILYALGNVYTSQALFDHGYLYHTRCLKQYRATLGDNHHRVGDVSYKLAEHNIRLENFKEAETFIDQAMKIFSGRRYHRNELARATHKKAMMLQAMGESQKAEEEFSKAFDIRQSLVTRDKRTLDKLSERDYDQLVIFWSR